MSAAPWRYLVLFAAVAWSATASADDWKQTFGADSVRDLLRGAKQGAVVVGAGANPVDRDAATAALVAALRQANPALVVMDGAALGTATDLADDAIVTKAGHLPIDRIIVVRAFPQGDTAVAVLTAYDKSGGSLAGLTARRGEALGARTAGQGVAGSTLDVVDKPGGKPDAELSPAEQEYAKRYIGFHGISVFGPGGAVTSWAYPYQGEGRTVLPPERFYTAVGRTDLADSYNARLHAKGWLTWGGMVVMIAGSALALGGGVSYAITSNETASTDERGNLLPVEQRGSIVEDPLFLSGIVLTGVGLGSLISGVAIDRHPVSPQEAVDLAREHNRALREELGLPPEEDDARDASDHATAVDLQVGFTALPGGGYLGLGGRF